MKHARTLKTTNLTKTFWRAAVLTLLVAASCRAQQTPPDGIKFEVVSVTVLTEKEALQRLDDYFGPDVAVRLRLSTGPQGMSFYGWKSSVIPGNYMIDCTEHGTMWLRGKTGKGIARSPKSLGLDAVLFGSSGDWIDLPAHSAVEWEELDFTSYAGQRHAFTVFMRHGSDKPVEIASDTFIVPKGLTSTQ
jgi:hypothetical protein